MVALPFLDAMIPALGRADTAKGPARMALVYFPNGVQLDSWISKTDSDIIAFAGEDAARAGAARTRTARTSRYWAD